MGNNLEIMKNVIKKILRWALEKELRELDVLTTSLKEKEIKLDNLLGNLDVSVDVHYRSRSWAVISIQGHTSDYIKFIDLGSRDIQEIQMFLSKFDRGKVDANPAASGLLRFN